MALTLAEANRMVQAAIGKADELNVKVSIAVCDAGGSLLAFNRMEGASAVSATVAQGKAAASAGFGRASGTLQADSPVIQAVIATMGGGCFRHRARCQYTRVVNSWGPSAAAAPPLSKTKSALRPGWLHSNGP